MLSLHLYIKTLFFFFKQKTAYEIRNCDWSSDVCSSDLADNASWHKSALTKSMFTQWQKKGLFIHFLPPRCPHLNLIETLWRKIKYEWLKTADFYSEKTMLKKLKRIFKNYGNDFCINFSMNIFKSKFNW